MPFPDNTPDINELINLPVGEIALLPVDLLSYAGGAAFIRDEALFLNV